MTNKNQIYKQRRDALLKLVAQEHPGLSGPVLLFAPCQIPNHIFVQDSSFYYFSGVQDAACVMQLSATEQILYQPDYDATREKWVATAQKITQDSAAALGFDTVAVTGKKVQSIEIYPYFDFAVYQHIVDIMNAALAH